MANITLNITISVPPLTDNAIWFANAAAWSNYWSGTGATVSIPAANTIQAGVVSQAATTAFVDPGITIIQTYTFGVDLTGGGTITNIVVPSEFSFNELRAQMETMVADYKVLKAAMVTAGLITTA